MTSSGADMTPVTRGELREELTQLEARLEQKLEEKLEEKLEQKLEEKLDQKLEEKLEQKLEEKLDQKLDQKLDHRLKHLATKTELEIWGGALLARIESGEQRMARRFDDLEQRLLTELARHTRAIQETLSKQVSVVDEKYASLPRRVSRLETTVFGSKKR